MTEGLGAIGRYDLTDSDWVDAVLDVNSGLRHGWRNYNWNVNQPAILYTRPAQELYRAFNRKAPRDWPPIWEQAGGMFYEGRMTALKNAEVWSAISRFGMPFPPFDFNSGMSVRDVDRQTAIRLGLIDRDSRVRLRSIPRPSELILWEPEPESILEED